MSNCEPRRKINDSEKDSPLEGQSDEGKNGKSKISDADHIPSSSIYADSFL